MQLNRAALMLMSRSQVPRPSTSPSATCTASSPGRGFRVLRRRDWQMSLKPLVKPRPKLTWLHLVGFNRPLWTEFLIVGPTGFGASSPSITLFLKVFGLFHNLMAFGGKKKQLSVSVVAFLEEEMKMMKRYNYRLIPTSVLSEPSGKPTTSPQMPPLSHSFGITKICDHILR